jgi:imidazoleglycerol-phosphate dehydratase
MRESTVERRTSETDIVLKIGLDRIGPHQISISTGIPFFDHMVHAMSRHGGFDLDITAKGDLEVDSHHTIEDIGIVLGTALQQALGDGRGIKRFGHAIIPMDEALAEVVIDCGGRGYLVFKGTFGNSTVGGIDTSLFEHFFYSLCIHAGITAHIRFSGQNDHHTAEAIFKAFGIALSQAVTTVPGSDQIPSTKGTL